MKIEELITIHAGKKTNGIDKEISNALPAKEAIKADIAEKIDKVIFSYVDRTERGNATNLYELVENRARSINMEIEQVKSELVKVNNIIVKILYEAKIYDNSEECIFRFVAWSFACQ